MKISEIMFTLKYVKECNGNIRVLGENNSELQLTLDSDDKGDFYLRIEPEQEPEKVSDE